MAELSTKYQAEYRRARTRRLIREGLCTGCGKLPPNLERSKRMCDICLDYAKTCWVDRYKESPKYKKVRNAYAQTYRDKVRLEVFNAYGGPTCICCGETEILFLELDHINNDGAQHKRELKCKSGYDMYWWSKKNNFPPIFQVMCSNCNKGKHRNRGVCPHKKTSI